MACQRCPLCYNGPETRPDPPGSITPQREYAMNEDVKANLGVVLKALTNPVVIGVGVGLMIGLVF